MNALAAAALAAGEMVCEFSDGYRKSLLAGIAGDPPRSSMPTRLSGASLRAPRPAAVNPGGSSPGEPTSAR